jgi:hypothetical protein
MQIDLDWLLEVLTVPHPIYQMMAGNIKISRFCATVAGLLSSEQTLPPDASTMMSLLERGEQLDLEFSMWHKGLPDLCMPCKFQTPKGKVILYPDITSAGVWNYYRGTRIILQQTILDIYMCLGGVHITLLRPNGVFSLSDPEKIIIDMVTDICDSIPFALGKVDPYGRQLPLSGPKAVQGHALLWPLFSVTQCGYATEAQKSQVRSALQAIGSMHGIRLGWDLSHEDLYINRSTPKSSRFSSLTLNS